MMAVNSGVVLWKEMCSCFCEVKTAWKTQRMQIHILYAAIIWSIAFTSWGDFLLLFHTNLDKCHIANAKSLIDVHLSSKTPMKKKSHLHSMPACLLAWHVSMHACMHACVHACMYTCTCNACLLVRMHGCMYWACLHCD